MRQPLLHDLTVDLRAPVVRLAGADGQIRPGGVQGLLCGDVRVLSCAVVTVDGVEPEPIGPGIGLLRDLDGDRSHDPTVWLRRGVSVAADGLTETLTLVNRSDAHLDVEVGVALGADMAPIAAIKQGASTAAVVPQLVGAELHWSGQGVDVRLTAPDAVLSPDALRWRVAVPARDEAQVTWTIVARDPAAVIAAAPHGLRRPPDPDRLLEQSFDDLDALLAVEPGRADVFATAGAPWFLTLFGRDALWTATMLLPVDVRIAGGTLRTLARHQGTRVDGATAEQPGKIPHELRRAATEHAHGLALPPLYYGTIDATPLWITLLRDASRAGLPAAEVAALLPNLHAALGWMDAYADRDGDGFAEYADDSGHGLANHGWKDSADSVRFASGRIADGPVALVEVQGYLHEAALAGAELLETFSAGDPTPWRTYAAHLRARFRERFWCTDAEGRFPALALDGDKKPVDSVTSNMGHLLGTGILDDAESAAVGARLLADDMASGYGLRTMSARAGGYSPLSYHCGSVWPHDTAIVIRGLLRSGQPGRAAELARQLVAAAEGFGRRLPELYAGYGRAETAVPAPYPASCRPQSWAAAAAVVVTEALRRS